MFRDRAEAAEHLSDALSGLELERPLVLGMPRGGVPLAAVVARRLPAELDVVVARKLGAPRNPEYALGAIAEGGVRFIEERAVRMTGTSPEDLVEVERREARELARRAETYRVGRAASVVEGRDCVIIDDGVATGATAIAACRSVRARGARAVTVAVPVAPAGWVEHLSDEADRLVAVETHSDFGSVGRWYADFRQVEDDEVLDVMRGRS